jgi:hypothetical protein
MGNEDYNSAAEYLLPLMSLITTDMNNPPAPSSPPTATGGATKTQQQQLFGWLSAPERRAIYWLADQVNQLEDDPHEASEQADRHNEL